MDTKKTTAPKGATWRAVKRHLPLYFMALPGIIYLIINNYVPMAGLVVAFKKYSAKRGIFGSEWIGFKNFKYLFGTSDALDITRNTLCYNIAFIIVGTVTAITVAILLSEIVNKRGSHLYQSVILLPFLISWVIISYLVYGFLSSDTGYINNTILAAFGKSKIAWYSQPKYWPVILVLVNLWHGFGYESIVYYASVVGIDRGYYEAAEIEGATKWQQIKGITLPLIRPTMITLILLAVGRIFYSDFGLFYQIPMNSGVLLPTTNVIDTYVYRGLLQNSNIGMSAAAGMYQSIVGFCVVMIANALVRKFDAENAFF